MKFLCVPCDEPMKLNRTLGPDEGSMTIVYRCPSCERETAMLTNAMETQMVRGLDIKIGGRSVPKAPMEFVKGTLTGTNLGSQQPAPGAAGPQHATATPSVSGGKCPFTHAVNEAYGAAADAAAEPADAPFVAEPISSEPVWTAEASARIERVPVYIRPMVRRGVEEYARSEGLTHIDAALMDDLKGRFM